MEGKKLKGKKNPSRGMDYFLLNIPGRRGERPFRGGENSIFFLGLMANQED